MNTDNCLGERKEDKGGRKNLIPLSSLFAPLSFSDPYYIIFRLMGKVRKLQVANFKHFLIRNSSFVIRNYKWGMMRLR
jgi:hypothetical protein